MASYLIAESAIVNDDSGTLMGILNADTSTVTLSNGKLGGPLLDGLVAGTGISISGVPTSGVGAPTISATNASTVVASATETEITATTTTTVLTYTPSATGQYNVQVSFRVVTATTTLTITASWYDAAGTAQTYTWLNAVPVAVGDYVLLPLDGFAAGSGGAITVSVTAGTANQVYVTGRIEQQV